MLLTLFILVIAQVVSSAPAVGEVDQRQARIAATGKANFDVSSFMGPFMEILQKPVVASEDNSSSDWGHSVMTYLVDFLLSVFSAAHSSVEFGSTMIQAPISLAAHAMNALKNILARSMEFPDLSRGNKQIEIEDIGESGKRNKRFFMDKIDSFMKKWTAIVEKNVQAFGTVINLLSSFI